MIKTLLICLLMPLLAVAQQETFTYSSTIKGKFNDLYVDNLDNIYLVNEDGQLKKLAPNGDSIAVYNNVRKFGKLYSVDVTHPLKILLYFKDFSTVVVLDRLLNARAVIDLRKLNLFQVSAVASSYDNNIWLYDEQEAQLKRINEEGKLLDQTTDFRMLFDSIPVIQNIIDEDRQLFLYDPAKGVYVFDYYGTLKRMLPFTGWKDFTVIKQALIGRDENFLYRYEPGSLKLQQLKIPAMMSKAKKMVIGQGKVYTLTEEGVVGWNTENGIRKTE